MNFFILNKISIKRKNGFQSNSSKYSSFSPSDITIFKRNYEEFCLWVSYLYSKKDIFFHFFGSILKNPIFRKAKIFLIFLSNNYGTNDFSNFLKLVKNHKYFHFLASSIHLSPVPLYFQTLRKVLVNILKNSSLKFIQKSSKIIIANWCYFYFRNSYFPIFSYCDSLFMKLFWKYARKNHPNKSKKWIQKKYFFQSIFSSFYFFYNSKHKNFLNFSPK